MKYIILELLFLTCVICATYPATSAVVGQEIDPSLNCHLYSEFKAACLSSELSTDEETCKCHEECEALCGLSQKCDYTNGVACCYEYGNGVVECQEGCDDGNLVDEDGCNSNMVIEAGFECEGDNPTTCDLKSNSLCPNGKTESEEECDDGNSTDGDGCSKNCKIESGYQCFGLTSSCNLICSNSVIDSQEQCDDGNTIDDDGCSSTCQVESGWECDTSVSPTTCNRICSNGKIDSGENCDDTNLSDSDGCSSTCQIESNYECSGVPSTCNLICSNSVIDSGEQCDDGGTQSGDGCDNNCQIEPGYECNDTPSNCNLICSNTVIDSGEQCDDGNIADGDGCSNTCLIEADYECSGAPSTCNLICSNGNNDVGEQCDDGNTSNGDGCSSSCQIESGYECDNEVTPNTCNLICTNGIIDSGEACDDQNIIDGDGCNHSCQVEAGWECLNQPSKCNLVCTNGRIDTGETCDDQNSIDGDGCDNACQVEPDWECFGEPSQCSLKCVNGKLDDSEQCDDNNLTGSDGCSALCKIETGYECTGEPSVCTPICGDGAILGTEQCDDANTINKDGCSDQCKQEDFHTCLGEPSVCNKTATPVFATSEAAAGTSFQAGIGSSVALGSVASMFLNIPTDGIWTLINALQILHYMPMLKLYFPQNILKMFSFTGMVNMENQMLSNIFLLHVDTNQINDKGPLDYRFENQGYESTSILLNSADSFAFLTLLTSYYVCVLILYFVMNCFQVGQWNKDKTSCITLKLWKFVSSVKEKLFVNTLFRILFEIFLDMFFCSVLNLAYLQYSSSMDIYSSGLSLVCILAMISFALVACALCLIRIFAPNKLTPCSDDIIMPHKSLDVLFENFNPEKKYAPLFHIIFLVQRMVLGAVIVLVRFSGMVQVVACAFMSLLKILFLLIIRPFTNPYLNFQEVYSEFVLMLTSLFFMHFKDISTEFAKTGPPMMTGYACILLLISILIVHYILMLIQVCSKFKKNSNKVRDDSVFAVSKNSVIRDFMSNKGTNEASSTSVVTRSNLPIHRMWIGSNNGIGSNINPQKEERKYSQDDLQVKEITISDLRNV
ncbi:unnamed protein product [Moneuplotes crassus]|uniref:DUF4215 domain-containing protein n=1 Tax=Euplotes crassus TaxID=5936 RepID=A0AAD1XSN3_EUPCR|nr:unnamed protein product [Moneuplotes crassus]